jgi:hypothetical protein
LKIFNLNKKILEFIEVRNQEEGLYLLDQSMQSRTGFWNVFHDIFINLSQGLTDFYIEECITTFKGKEKYSHTLILVDEDYKDSLERVYACLIDITDIINVNHELNKYKHNLEELVDIRVVQLNSEIERRKQLEKKLLDSYKRENSFGLRHKNN